MQNDPAIAAYFANRGQYFATTYLTPKLTPFEYQWRAVRYMLLREQFAYYGVQGGINGQDMGMGKTLEMLLLILTDKLLLFDSTRIPIHNINLFNRVSSILLQHNNANAVTFNATLIVVNDACLSVWCKNIKEHFNEGVLRYVIVGSPAESLLPPKNGDAPIDIVFIKPHALIEHYKRREDKGSVFQFTFHRMILEEGHVARNPKTGLSAALMAVKAVRRWIISGTIITNTHADGAAMLLILQMQHPFLQSWKDSGMRCALETLEQHGLTLQFVSACLFVFSLFRTKATPSDKYFVQETDPSEFMLSLAGIPPELPLPLIMLAQYPSRAWEFGLALDKNNLFDMDMSMAIDLYYRYAMYISHQKHHHQRQLQHNLEDVALELFARDLGIQRARIRYLKKTNTNAYTTAQIERMTARRIMCRLILLVMVDDRNFCIDPVLGSVNFIQSIKDSAVDKIQQWRAQCLKTLKPYVEWHRVLQQWYTSMFESMMQVCKQRNLLSCTMQLNCHWTKETYVFVRPETGYGLRVYEAFAEQLVANARIETKTPGQQHDMLSYYTFLRQVAFHPDTVIVERRGIDKLLPRASADVLQYYNNIKAPSHIHTDEQWFNWIVQTAYKRHISTKMKMLHEYYTKSVFPGERLVYFGKYRSTVRMMHHYVNDVMQVPCLYITGEENMEQRQAILGKMERGEAIILCATLGVCAEAYSFTWANHSIDGDSWYNGTKRTQGLDRINRPGQQRITFQSIFLLQHSFDEIMYKLTGAKVKFGMYVSGSAQQTQRHVIDTNVDKPVSALALYAGERTLLSYEQYTQDVFAHSRNINNTTERRAEVLHDMHARAMRDLERTTQLYVNLNTGTVSLDPTQQAGAPEVILPTLPTFQMDESKDDRSQHYKMAIEVIASQMHL